MSAAIGVDIGGTGIKASLVDIATGDPAGSRLEARTPAGGAPADIADVTARLVAEIGMDAPLGSPYPRW